MQIQSAFTSAVQGYQRAEPGIKEASAEIARQPVAAQNLAETTGAEQQVTGQNVAVKSAASPAVASREAEQPRPVTDEIVKLRLEERNAQANVRTLQTADQVVGSLINTTA